MTAITGWFPPRCPECINGKCRNCTGWTLDKDDNTIDCECEHVDRDTPTG